MIKKVPVIIIFVLIVSIIFIFVLQIGCKRNPGEEPPEFMTGELIEADGIEIYFPPEIQEDKPQIKISKIRKRLPPPPEGSDTAGDAFEIESGGDLPGPVIITLPYDQSRILSEAGEKNLYIATLIDGIWQPVPGGFVDTENNTVSVAVDHFSVYQLYQSFKEEIYDLYETVMINETINKYPYDKLPDEIIDDIKSMEINLKPKYVKAITLSKISWADFKLLPYVKLVNKTAGIAIATYQGTKKAILEAGTQFVLYEIAEYEDYFPGYVVLRMYDSVQLGRAIADLAITGTGGLPAAAATGSNWLLSGFLEYFYSNDGKCLNDIGNLNPYSTDRLQLYTIHIDTIPNEENPIGVKGTLYYYYNQEWGQWLNFCNNMIAWTFEYQPEQEYYKVENVSTDSAEKDQKTQTEEEYEKEASQENTEEIPKGPVQAYLNPEGTGDYIDIEEAVRSVPPGSTIFLDSGTYYLTDEIYIDKDIEIVGSRVDLVDVRYDGSGDDYFFDIEHHCNIIIEDITFTAEGHVYHILDIENAEIQINNCRFMGASDAAIYTDEKTNGVIKDCEFSNNGQGIFAGGNGYITIENNIATDNKNGIGVYADGEIVDNNCSWNTYDGIETGVASDILIENNICSNNGADGISISSECTALVRNNECFNNENGIAARLDASPTLEYNICYNNEEMGILFTDDSSGSAGQNDCYDNAIGLAVRIDASPQLADNYCYDNYEKDID